jgi:hypothetical protein
VDTYQPEIDPVEKYALAEKYAVEEWKTSSFEILYQRIDPLTVQEAEKLGVVIATQVFLKREEILKLETRSQHTASPTPSFTWPVSPRDIITALEQMTGSSKTSQLNSPSTISAAVTTAESVANFSNLASMSPNNTSTSSKAKLDSLGDQKIFSNPQPTPNQPSNGHSTGTGNVSAPTPAPSSPPVSGKSIDIPSTEQSESNSGPVFLGFAELDKSKQPYPLGPAPIASQGQGRALFTTPAPPFIFTPKQ